MFIVERIISLIAPHQCVSCRTEGTIVCDWCLPGIAPSLPPRCYRCQRQTEQSLVCNRCRRGSRLKHVWVRTGYEDGAKQLIHDFKFMRKQAVAEPLAQLMAESLPFLPAETIVTHVPTASGRIRKRGYDQAELLAKALARKLGLRFRPLLVRTGQARQVGSSRSERLNQLKDVFKITKSLDSSPILLVDDLVTTGGTLEAAARVLKQAGAKRVDAAVFAQKE